MRAQIRGLDMASKNTQDGISLIQTAEGGLQEVDNMIQRIRELVVQAANDTNDFYTNDRKKLQDEINQLTQGIDNMARQVEFNAKKLLDGGLMDQVTKAELLADIDVRLVNIMGSTYTGGSGSMTGTTVSDIAADIAADGGTSDPVSMAGRAFSAAMILDNVLTTTTLTDVSGGSWSQSGITFSATVFEDISKLEAFVEDAGKDMADLTAARASAAISSSASATPVADYDKAINALRGQIEYAQKLTALLS
jgi:flagellin